MKKFGLIVAAVSIIFMAGCSNPKDHIDIAVFNDSTVYDYKITNTSGGTVLDGNLAPGASGIYTVLKGDCLEYNRMWLGSSEQITNECYEASATVHLN